MVERADGSLQVVSDNAEHDADLDGTLVNHFQVDPGVREGGCAHDDGDTVSILGTGYLFSKKIITT